MSLRSFLRFQPFLSAIDMLRSISPSTKQWGVLRGLLLLLGAGCSPYRHALPPRVVPHARWEATPALGHAADATRRNRRAGDTLSFRDLTVVVLDTRVDSSGAKPVDVARLELVSEARRETRVVREGEAFNWGDHHLAVVAIYGPGELGAGLVAIEVGRLATLPDRVAGATEAPICACASRIASRTSRCITRATRRSSVRAMTQHNGSVTCRRGGRAIVTGGMSPITSSWG
jgi:hypothetical protein